MKENLRKKKVVNKKKLNVVEEKGEKIEINSYLRIKRSIAIIILITSSVTW